MLTCFGVANSSMNPDPEPVHDGPIQVYIMSGQPACVEGPVLMAPPPHPHPLAWLCICSCLRSRARIEPLNPEPSVRTLISRFSTPRPVQHGGVRLRGRSKCPLGVPKFAPLLRLLGAVRAAWHSPGQCLVSYPLALTDTALIL